MPYPPVLARKFYQRRTEDVARDLLGKLLVRRHPDGDVVVRICEVEAYLGVNDPACHTHGGRRTPRTESMWGPAGRAYVYLVYGIHHCLNAVTVGEGVPEAVLIRGAEVVHGLDLIRTRRGSKTPTRSLIDGPGKLCQALAVTRAEDGGELWDPDSALVVGDDGALIPEPRVRYLPRVGVDYAGEAARWPLRYVTDSTV